MSYHLICCAVQMELQACTLRPVVVSFFRDEAAATALANTVDAHGGVMGAAVCCAEDGGNPADDWTTCDADRDLLLDRWATRYCFPIEQISKAKKRALHSVVEEEGDLELERDWRQLPRGLDSV